MVQTPSAPRQLVVVGDGMVAHRFVEALRSRDAGRRVARRPCSARSRARRTTGSRLSSYFSGRDPEDLALGGQELWDDPLVDPAPRRRRDRHRPRGRAR